MIIIIDTDFLSSLLKINRLEIVRDLFKEENVHIPVAVLNEVAKTELIADLVSKDWVKVRKVKEEDLRKMERDKEFANLGSGEKECIVLCKQIRGSILLISDNKASKIANKNDIMVLNIPAVLLACKQMKILNIEDIVAIIRDLKEKDYYEFSEEERNRLINN